MLKVHLSGERQYKLKVYIKTPVDGKDNEREAELKNYKSLPWLKFGKWMVSKLIIGKTVLYNLIFEQHGKIIAYTIVKIKRIVTT